MNEILDKPTILPIYPNLNPFDDEFKSKWYDRYKNDECTLDHIQRLYNIDKLTKEDFILITDEEPKDKDVADNEVIKLQKKITILQSENKHLKEVTKEQDDLLVDNAYKITMLEMAIGGI